MVVILIWCWLDLVGPLVHTFITCSASLCHGAEPCPDTVRLQGRARRGGDAMCARTRVRDVKSRAALTTCYTPRARDALLTVQSQWWNTFRD